MTFAEFFRALWDREPFPWQARLAEKVATGEWPASIGLPTAAGKTALIDIAVWALTEGAPQAARRIFFVVDRRVIVDEAAERAQKIADRLAEAERGSHLYPLAQRLRELGTGDLPLAVATLRGGIRRDDSWTDSPLQPLVVCSTVDQVGSSLLFQAYGCRNYQWPVRAALTANDSLILLDEAHTSQPFAETLGWVRRLSTWAETKIAQPLTVVEMSATPRESLSFREEEEDRTHPVLASRWTASKRAALVDPVESDAFVSVMVREARAMQQRDGVRIVGVIANRVRTAREIFEQLSTVEGARAILLTGRARPYDRDRIWESEKPLLRADRDTQPAVPLFVVSTQCIEVGADISFDALVTEIASIDALEQRFGRLDRLGTRGVSHAAIVATKDCVRAKANDPVYGATLPATWTWLSSRLVTEQREIAEPAEVRKKPKVRKIKEQFVEMGVLALRDALATTGHSTRDGMTKPREHAPILMPAHLDLLSQTSPEPAAVPDVSLYLHGPEAGPADVEVVWRADLKEEESENWLEAISICPPVAAEALAAPVWAVRKWLAKLPSADFSDLEGENEPNERDTSSELRRFLLWRGPDDSSIGASVDELKPGVRIVVPSSYGGCDAWGWNPISQVPVIDVGDAVKLAAEQPLIRLDPDLAAQWNYSSLAADLRQISTVAELRDVLNASVYPDEGFPGKVLLQLKKSTRLKLVRRDEETIAVIGRGAFEQDSRFAQFTVEVGLQAHLDGVEQWAAKFASHLPQPIRQTLIDAARVHDIGKADRRFQALLRGGVPAFGEDPLAKSGRNGQSREAYQRARDKAGYPRGCRHEVTSVAMLEHRPHDFPNADFDLLLHVVGAHHGRCRPFAPALSDPDGPEVRYGDWSGPANHCLASVGSGVSERFWKLTRRYGWYGLAYLEAVLRLADARCSEEEQKNARD
jgi:CRISPR-associated endonuclease/helicase Cas3